MALQIKKFQAQTLQQAIEQIRTEMGDDAIILQTEPIKGGVFGRSMIEVTAAIDRNENQARFHAMLAEATDERPVAKPTQARAALTSTQIESGKKSWLGFLKTVTPTKPAPKSEPAAKPQATAPAMQPKPVSKAPETTESSPSMGQLYAVKTFVDPLKKEVEELKQAFQRKNESPLAKKPKVKDPLEEEVQKLREEIKSFMLESRLTEEKIPRYFQQLAAFWRDHGLTEKHITKVLEEIESWGGKLNETTTSSQAVETINQLLSGVIQEADVFQKQEQRIVVLVGPTGVGKTTTIAKMAAFEKLRLRRKVTFVTVDDFKIGGTDQLAHYARILEVPFIKSRTDLSLEEQIKSLKADTIYIDTFGFSPHDAQRFEALKRILNFEDQDLKQRVEIHLVLPVGVAAQDVSEIWKTYSAMNPEYLAFTKWDETNNWGGMLAAILTCRKPVSFISHGQNVPDDFALFSKQSFIETVTSI